MIPRQPPLNTMSANETPSIPFPPEELLQRTGNVDRADPERAYDAIGKAIRSQIEDILPSDWSWSGIRVLDFGCGAGRVLRHFISEASSSEFWGCDIDHPSIEWINENLCPPLHALACNEEPGLDLPDGFFNLIYSISVFTHLTKHSAGWLIELHRVLAPKGLLLVSFLGEGRTQPLLNENWQEERIGFNAVLHGNS